MSYIFIYNAVVITILGYFWHYHIGIFPFWSPRKCCIFLLYITCIFALCQSRYESSPYCSSWEGASLCNMYTFRSYIDCTITSQNKIHAKGSGVLSVHTLHSMYTYAMLKYELFNNNLRPTSRNVDWIYNCDVS